MISHIVFPDLYSVHNIKVLITDQGKRGSVRFPWPVASKLRLCASSRGIVENVFERRFSPTTPKRDPPPACWPVLSLSRFPRCRESHFGPAASPCPAEEGRRRPQRHHGPPRPASSFPWAACCATSGKASPSTASVWGPPSTWQPCWSTSQVTDRFLSYVNQSDY